MANQYPTKPYVDSAGVRRGWYVYLHVNTETQEVFYVGMGVGRRAWDVLRRSRKWKEAITTAHTSWRVEIVKGDLSEIEAEQLEEDTIQKYGGVYLGSPLANILNGENWIRPIIKMEDFESDPHIVELFKVMAELAKTDRGRELLGFHEIVEFEPIQCEWSEAVNRAEKFNGALLLLRSKFEAEIEELSQLDRNLNDDVDEEFESGLEDLAAIGQEISDGFRVLDEATHYLRRRQISWREFCGTASNAYQNLHHSYYVRLRLAAEATYRSRWTLVLLKKCSASTPTFFRKRRLIS